MEEREKYNWNAFVVYCIEEGISLEDESDYGDWWDCWKAGAEASKERS